MKHYFQFFLFCFPYLVLAQTWQQTPDFPSPERDDAVCFKIADSVYAGTGISGGFENLRDLYQFDPITESWIQKNSLPAGEQRQYSIAFSSGNFGFVFGGHNGSDFLNDLWRYDAQNDSWMEMESLPGAGRGGSSVFQIGDTAFILGGKSTDSTALAEMWAYHIPSDTWHFRNYLPTGPNWKGSAVSNGQTGYLIFGKNHQGIFNTNFWKYDPISGWTTLSNYTTTGRIYGELVYHQGVIYSLFGQNENNEHQSDLWSYSIQNNSWSQLPSLPSVARKGGAGFWSETSLYYTTGITSTNRLKETWKYDPIVNIFEIEGSHIQIYPNPFFDQFQISGDFELQQIELFTELGQKITFEQTNENSIFIQNIPAGFYFLKCKIGDEIQWLRVQKI